MTKKLPTTIFIIRKLIHRFLGQDFYSNSGKFKASITNWRVVIKTVLKFCAMARFEEAIELKRSNFNFLQSGDLEITFLKGKNYNSHDAKKTVLAKLDSEYCPVRLIRRYFRRLNYPKEVDGFFLPAVKSTTRTVPGSLRKIRDQVAEPFHPISYSTCRNDFKMALREIGLNDTLYGEHSDRIGGLSAAANAGVSWTEAAAHGRWKPGSSVPKSYVKRNFKNRKAVSQKMGF